VQTNASWTDPGEVSLDSNPNDNRPFHVATLSAR
jgi:hypothetical protein